MALKQQLGLRQRLGLTPQMRQSIDVLGLSWEGLVARLRAEAEANPFLRLRIPDAFAMRGTTAGSETGARSATGATAYDVALASVPAERSARDALRDQIALMPLERAVRAAAETLVHWLDDAGYLTDPIEEIARVTGLPEKDLARGHAALRSCEPAGVGATSLHDCLALQLADQGASPVEIDAILSDPRGFAQQPTTELAGRTGITGKRIEALRRILARLTPRPLSDGAAAAVPRIPELEVIRRTDGRLRVQLAEDRQIAAWVDDIPARAAGTDLQKWEARARALVAALQGRNRTLLAIGAAIIDRQARFFLDPAAPLAPMLMRDIAQELSFHPSTVSRAVAGKSLACDRGILPLSALFSRRAPGGSSAVSVDHVKQRIAALIRGESPQAPLSDERIRAELMRDGVDISRRAVAKYRQCLSIPSSRRRRHGGPAFQEKGPGSSR